MIEPICKKCFGVLEKDTKRNLWICQKCRSTYIYAEPAYSDEQFKLKNFSDRLAYCADQAMLNMQELMRMMTEFKQIIRCDKAEFVLSKYEESYELLHDSTQIAKELIESMEARAAPVGDGYFEELI